MRAYASARSSLVIFGIGQPNSPERYAPYRGLGSTRDVQFHISNACPTRFGYEAVSWSGSLRLPIIATVSGVRRLKVLLFRVSSPAMSTCEPTWAM